MHLNSIPGIKAFIWSGGNKLKEYDDTDEVENEGPHSARTYIEAIDEATFEIEIEALSYVFNGSHTLAATIYVDGICAYRPLISPRHRRTMVAGAKDIVGPNQANLRRFVFNRIETTEDQDSTNIPENVDRIGEIEIRFHRKTVTGRSRRIRVSAVNDTVEKLSEKSLKGRSVTHGISFAPPEPTTSKPPQKMAYLDGKDKPLVVLKFLYRSKAALRSLLIIPRIPSPALPSPSSSRLNRMPKVNSTQKDVQVKREKTIKRERNGNSQPGSSKKFKRERDDDSQPGPSKKKRVRSSLIDLTGEYDENNAPALPLKRFETEDGKEGIDLT